jgi:hypothetical protein
MAVVNDRKKKRPGPSGSDKRQRVHIVPFRVDDPEREELHRRARRAGITVGAYIRHQTLDKPPPRQSSRPAIEVQVLARLVGQLGKIGSNLNQIAFQMNASGRADELDVIYVQSMAADLTALRAAALRAMGRTP